MKEERKDGRNEGRMDGGKKGNVEWRKSGVSETGRWSEERKKSYKGNCTLE